MSLLQNILVPVFRVQLATTITSSLHHFPVTIVWPRQKIIMIINNFLMLQRVSQVCNNTISNPQMLCVFCLLTSVAGQQSVCFRKLNPFVSITDNCLNKRNINSENEYCNAECCGFVERESASSSVCSIFISFRSVFKTIRTAGQYVCVVFHGVLRQ